MKVVISGTVTNPQIDATIESNQIQVKAIPNREISDRVAKYKPGKNISIDGDVISAQLDTPPAELIYDEETQIVKLDLGGNHA